MRQPLIIGAHKLFMNLHDAIAFAEQLRTTPGLSDLQVEAVVSPSLINLAHVATVLADAGIGIAAQTFDQERRGAHTGQVSLEELVQLGVRFVILGHHELAVRHAEQNADALGGKVAACLRCGVRPIVFCPELPDDSPALEQAVEAHVGARLGPAFREQLDLSAVVIAHESLAVPSTDEAAFQVWREATARKLLALRKGVAALFGAATPAPRIVYGGGVSEALVPRLLRELALDGLLIGRASTDAASFARILTAAHRATSASPDWRAASELARLM